MSNDITTTTAVVMAPNGADLTEGDIPRAPIHVATYKGFRYSDRNGWRRVECPTCPKFTDFVNPTTDRMDWVVNTHVCGVSGGPWAEGSPPPAGPGSAYALLLRSVTEAVSSWGYASCEIPQVAAAAQSLVEVLESHLEAAAIRSGEEPPPDSSRSMALMYARRLAGSLVEGEPVYVSVGELLDDHALPASPAGREAIGVSWPDFAQCSHHAIEDVVAGRLAVARASIELGLVVYAQGDVDPSVHHELIECAGCVADRRAQLQVVDAVPTPADGVPAPFVDSEGRQWVSAQMLVTYGLPSQAIGVQWAQWSQCAAHVAEDLTSGMLGHAHQPAEQARLILDGEGFDPAAYCEPCIKAAMS